MKDDSHSLDSKIREAIVEGRRAWLEQCVRAAFASPGLVAEFDRVRGTNLAIKGSNLDLQIDLACNRLEGDVALFVAFVQECVASRVAPE